MGGFRNDDLNMLFVRGVIDTIVAHLIKCSQKMRSDCVQNSNPLRNHEDKITNRLVAKYLNAEPNGFHYERESPENFDEETDTYIGRTDIKVLPWSHFCGSEAYFVIECKRVDGSYALNRLYITEGVARFVEFPLKYPSYYNLNIMFGYIVKSIDIVENASKIDALQRCQLTGVSASAFVKLESENSRYFLFTCEYFTENTNRIELLHLFYDFADVMEKEQA